MWGAALSLGDLGCVRILFFFFGLFILFPAVRGSAVQELLMTEIVLGRRDIPAYVALLQLCWHLSKEVLGDPSRPRSCRGGCKNLFVVVGTIQESLIAAFNGSRCRRCGFRNAACLCDVVFRFAHGRFETVPVGVRFDVNVKRVRTWLAGLPCLNRRGRARETKNSWLLPLLFHANIIKVVLFCCILDLGCTSYGFGLGSFVKTWLNESETLDFRMASLICGWFSVRPHGSYIGESCVGFGGRFRSHLKAFLSLHQDTGLHPHAQYLYEKMLTHGLRWYVVMPLFLWERAVPKVVRLQKEALSVWVRQPTLNISGIHDVERSSRFGGDEYYTPKKKRFRLVKRLRMLKKRQNSTWLIELSEKQKLFRQQQELNRRNHLFALLARIARRPLQVGPDFTSLKVVNRVLLMVPWKLSSMVRLASSCLNGPTRAIFFSNFTKMIKFRPDVHYGRWLQSSPLYAVPWFRRQVKKALQSWVSSLAHRGFMLILRVRISFCASPNLMEQFSNTKKWSKKQAHECICQCSSMVGTPFNMLEGCVFFPLSLFLRFVVGGLPPAWNVRTRMVPSWPDLMLDFSEKGQSLVDRVSQKFSKIAPVGSSLLSRAFGSPRWEMQWQPATSHLQCSALESSLDALYVLFSKYVIAPVDKIRGEAMIMCPMRYARAIEKLSEDYFPVTASDYDKILSRFFKMGEGFPKLVYSRLRPARYHQFGLFRAWVKGKALVAFPECWGALSWRPLVAYSRHRWKFTLSFLARYCTFLVRRYKLGVGVCGPWEVLVKVAEFNQCWLDAAQRAGDIALEWGSLDIEGFFPRMERSRVRAVLTKWTRQLCLDHPTQQFFCVGKIRSPETLQPLPLSGRTRLVRKVFLSRTITRYEIGMEVARMPDLLASDFHTDVIHVLGQPMRASAGLSIGSPLAATAASMVAGDREKPYLDSLPPAVRVNLKKMSLMCRWQNDVLQFRFGRLRFLNGFLALETMLSEFFYGPTLRLKRVPEPRGFGYEFYIFGEHFLALQPINKFARVEPLRWVGNRSSLQFNIGQGFGQNRTLRAEIKGYVTSLLDRSNGIRQNLLLSLIRLVCEFRLRGMPQDDVVACMHTVLPQSRFILPSNWADLYVVSVDEVRKFCVGYDHMRHSRSLAMVATQHARWIASGWTP